MFVFATKDCSGSQVPQQLSQLLFLSTQMTTFLSHIQPSPPSSVNGSSLEWSPDRIKALFNDECYRASSCAAISLNSCFNGLFDSHFTPEDKTIVFIISFL